MTDFRYLPPIIIPAADYAAPAPGVAQPVVVLARKDPQIWVVPSKLDAMHDDWSITQSGEFVRVPMHSPFGGFNTRDDRDVSLIAATLAVGFEMAQRFGHRFEGYSSVAVQLVIGDCVHEFAAGTFEQCPTSTFRFYVGVAFEVGGK